MKLVETVDHKPTIWKPVDSSAPRLCWVLTRRKGRKGSPDHIVSARQLPGTLCPNVSVWRDTQNNIISLPDDWTEIPL